MERNNFIETNRSSWNQKTEEHFNSQFYDVKGFLEGKSSLNSIELDETLPSQTFHLVLDTFL